MLLLQGGPSCWAGPESQILPWLVEELLLKLTTHDAHFTETSKTREREEEEILEFGGFCFTDIRSGC